MNAERESMGDRVCVGERWTHRMTMLCVCVGMDVCVGVDVGRKRVSGA